MVFLKLLLVGLCFFALPQGIQAKEKAKLLGYGLLFTNDFFGDGSDRWRTGSLVSSRVFGSPKMSLTLPRREALNELRLFSQIIAPSDFVKNTQVSNQFILGTLAEVARPSALPPSTNIRPFVEVQTGVEDLIRIGVDAGFLVICPKHSLQERPFQGSVIAL